jgi:enoyl-CoA hydratase/carnithine racemase
MNYHEIVYSVAERVATVTLNRPDKLNAWTAVMEEEFEAALQRASADENVRAILVTGAGRGFCAGADMSLLNRLSKAGGEGGAFPSSTGAEAYRRRYSWMLEVPKPVIAAVNGPAVGLGCVIPLYCDIRLASPKAQFCTVFARRGLIAEFGIAWMLPHLVGLGNAIDMLFTARMVGAEEALRMGLVSELMGEEDFPAHSFDFAKNIANSLSPRSLGVIKKQIYASLAEPLGGSIERAYEQMLASLKSDDFKEGVAHFLEKRAPRFPGR